MDDAHAERKDKEACHHRTRMKPPATLNLVGGKTSVITEPVDGDLSDDKKRFKSKYYSELYLKQKKEEVIFNNYIGFTC